MEQSEEQNKSEEQNTLEQQLMELNNRIVDLEEALALSRSRAQRAVDELEAAKLRIARESEKRAKKDRADLLLSMLELLDLLERAIDASGSANLSDQEQAKSVSQGVALVHHTFIKNLASHGVRKLETELGSPFDPELHDAVAYLPVSNPAQANCIVGVSKTGYLIKEELLRAAEVAVGKG